MSTGLAVLRGLPVLYGPQPILTRGQATTTKMGRPVADAAKRDWEELTAEDGVMLLRNHLLGQTSWMADAEEPPLDSLITALPLWCAGPRKRVLFKG
jgi:hypothetical protein